MRKTNSDLVVKGGRAAGLQRGGVCGRQWAGTVSSRRLGAERPKAGSGRCGGEERATNSRAEREIRFARIEPALPFLIGSFVLESPRARDGGSSSELPRPSASVQASVHNRIRLHLHSHSTSSPRSRAQRNGEQENVDDARSLPHLRRFRLHVSDPGLRGAASEPRRASDAESREVRRWAMREGLGRRRRLPVARVGPMPQSVPSSEEGTTHIQPASRGPAE